VVLLQTFDLSEEERGPLPAAQGPGTLGSWVQCLHISLGLFKGGFPEEKGAAFGAKDIQGGFQPVLLSEGDNLDTSFRFVCYGMLPKRSILPDGPPLLHHGIVVVLASPSCIERVQDIS